MKQAWIQILIIFIVLTACESITDKKDDSKLLSKKEYQEKVYASWLGQIIGNTYGLCYEFKYINEPGPDQFPYGYTWTLEELKKYNGAFSDDDTDIEYMYLTQMEKHGIEPSYFHLSNAWKTHVKERVWCANRMALNLMHAGHYPPVTGAKEYNPQWCQIDPQLVNEIWAVTAPAMIDYSVQKSEFAARITNDDFGIEPTLHYAAMYSAAFFEKDIHQLIEIGVQALEPNSKFVETIQFVKNQHQNYPQNWQIARQNVVNKYYVFEEYNKHCWPVVDANLNGALGILALLYGDGDFQKTLDFSCAFGMDADNQAATMCGLLGIANGFESIPEDLMFPLKYADWEMPFNDVYKMVTREGLEDAKISDMAHRIALQGENIILAKGGIIVQRDGQEYYQINTSAQYQAPLELNPLPQLFIEVNQEFSYPIYTGGHPSNTHLNLMGELPLGVEVEDNHLKVNCQTAGSSQFQLQAIHGDTEISIPVHLHVYERNHATDAIEIVFNSNAIDQNIEIIRDGSIDHSYSSIKSTDQRELDYYGYIWEQGQEISAISFNTGIPSEFCGWFTSLDVEYLLDGIWKKIDQIEITPEMNFENTQWLKAHLIDYHIHFKAVNTKGIRIIGMSGGIEKDAGNAHLGLQYYTTISELKVYRQ